MIPKVIVLHRGSQLMHSYPHTFCLSIMFYSMLLFISASGCVFQAAARRVPAVAELQAFPTTVPPPSVACL